MASRKRKAPKGKKVNPKFWVFCEGETEEAFIYYLKAKYRLPFKIIPKIIGQNISDDLIERHKNKKETHIKDKTFLIYDADVPDVLNRLKAIKKGKLLATNPTIEYWFLLHYKNQTGSISEAECIRQLCNRNHNTYKKGLIDDKLKQQLDTKQNEANKRAKQTRLYENPSSNIFEFLEELEQAKGEI
ncbi:RloB family protein [Saccharicrinis fermentans]|uniref:RloB-like protein n=1 Tax=Saccharicrinis fermentans DSM 9555 = JCM 21142 TaxID=869213 RepID=W7YEP8_9BACT|nr:RloB family protein [Saccharicrinis fermentans]GAF05948.1 hypothetical protein JCM21142_134713 [Saccharicrinis fermentans DSM 9555 = JCM 21142]